MKRSIQFTNINMIYFHTHTYSQMAIGRPRSFNIIVMIFTMPNTYVSAAAAPAPATLVAKNQRTKCVWCHKIACPSKKESSSAVAICARSGKMKFIHFCVAPLKRVAVASTLYFTFYQPTIVHTHRHISVPFGVACVHTFHTDTHWQGRLIWMLLTLFSLAPSINDGPSQQHFSWVRTIIITTCHLNAYSLFLCRFLVSLCSF